MRHNMGRPTRTSTYSPLRISHLLTYSYASRRSETRKNIRHNTPTRLKGRLSLRPERLPRPHLSQPTTRTGLFPIEPIGVPHSCPWLTSMPKA